MLCCVNPAGAQTPTGLIFYKCVFPRWVEATGNVASSLGTTSQGQEESTKAASVTNNLLSGETVRTNSPL